MPVRLVEVFRRALREAKLDIDKFTRWGRPGSDDIRKQDYAQKPPEGTVFTTADDEMRKSTEQGRADKAAAERAELSDPKIKQLLPRAKRGSGISYTHELDAQSAKAWGWKKTQNFYVNPKHWARGSEGDYNSLEWAPGEWLKPVSPGAMRLARRLQDLHMMGREVYKPNVWEQYFADEWGDL